MQNISSFKHLQRSLSPLETWAFGLTAHLSWISLVPAIHLALGSQAIFVWIPAVILGMLLNYQVKHLGANLIDVAGGTPNYITKLWYRYPLIAQCTAIGYTLNWMSYLSLNSIVITDIIKVNLQSLNIPCPELILKIGFTLLPFIVAFRGTKALSILHLSLVFPAFLLLLIFCVQGLGFLIFSDQSPGFFPHHWEPLSYSNWAKWFFFVSYATYSCETCSSFVADSLNPQKTLRFLKIAAWLMIPVFVGGSWIIIRLVTVANANEDAFLTFVTASKPFWGEYAPMITTFLLVSSSLLGSTTTVSNCPRIIYQLAVDQYLSKVFSVVSPQGVLSPALFLNLFVCLIYLTWGNVSQIVVLGNVSWFVSFIILHLGMWQQRHHPGVILPKLALGMFTLEIIVLFVGGLSWGWQNFIIGLLAPFSILIIDLLVRYTPLPIFRLRWWYQLYQSRRRKQVKDSVILQVVILILLLSITVLIGCLFGWNLKTFSLTEDAFSHAINLMIILLLTVIFTGIAIACWTSLPQVMALVEARECAEHLFSIAKDCILVVDSYGIIQQANPASESLFSVSPAMLLGKYLKRWLPELGDDPEDWAKRCEQTLVFETENKTLEISISDRYHQDFPEYVVIIYDITQRKQAAEQAQAQVSLLSQQQQILQQQAQELEQTLQELQQTQLQLIQREKMSSLGQLVAGIAHEINNPISFIYSNISHAKNYTRDLLKLLYLYEKYYPHPSLEIQHEIEAIELNFLVQDLPKMLNSMQVGAERIKQIVLSLRNFSRLDEVGMKAVNIHEGIDNTLMILASRLKFSTKYPAINVIKKYGDIPSVECYAGQLNQVFMNIIINAIDALEEALANGKIFQPEICIQTQITDLEHVVIAIIDNGSGIPKSIQKQIFDPFFTTKSLGKGPGLGLFISYQIIHEKHHGRLHCISSPEKGTEFIIEIPLCQPRNNVNRFSSHLLNQINLN